MPVHHYFLAPLFLLYKLWIGLVFWLTLLLLYPAFYILLRDKRYYARAFRLKKIWSRLLMFLLLCPMRTERKGKLPKPPYIICSNHSSYLDTVFMYSLFSDYFLFVGKGELLKWPLFRTFFKTMDIPIHREHSRKAFTALQKAYDALDRGECVAIYPEGTIPESSPRMKSFRNGAFRMAVDKQVPIVPVTWLTNYKIMKDPAKIFGFSLPQFVKVVVHDAVVPASKNDSEEKMMREKVFTVIQSAFETDGSHNA